MWRVNNTVVTSCGFRDIINIIAAVPRPFVVDFVRPTRKLDLGHSVLYNNIQFDMVRVDTPGGEAKVMPAAALRQTASEHSLKLKSKVCTGCMAHGVSRCAFSRVSLRMASEFRKLVDNAPGAPNAEKDAGGSCSRNSDQRICEGHPHDAELPSQR